jgi:alpha-N-arabinofuranosidase
MRSPTPDFVAAAAYALPYAVGPYFDQVQAQVDKNPELRGKVHFAVTEWLFNSKGFGERNFTNESPSWMNEGGAVLAAGFLNTLLRHSSEVKIADMTGIMEFAGIWKHREQVYAMPAYYAFQMYTPVKGDTILPLTSDSGTYSVRGGVKPLDSVDSVPYIDVVATRSRDGRTVTLLCVNRSLEQDVPTHFDLGSMRITGAGQMQQIKSVSRYERNDEVEPEHVVPVPSTVTAGDGKTLTVTLPRESVSVIRVPVS